MKIILFFKMNNLKDKNINNEFITNLNIRLKKKTYLGQTQ